MNETTFKPSGKAILIALIAPFCAIFILNSKTGMAIASISFLLIVFVGFAIEWFSKTDRHIRYEHAKGSIFNRLFPVRKDTPAHSRVPNCFFSYDYLRKMDWLLFEKLTLELIQIQNYRVVKSRAGADGGIDLYVYSKSSKDNNPIMLVQCKARTRAQVDVRVARELFGVMAANKVSTGILATNSTFTKDAREFAQNNPSLILADISWITTQLKLLPESKKIEIEKTFFGKDYDVPSCPICELKMIQRASDDEIFLACPNTLKGTCNHRISKFKF